MPTSWPFITHWQLCGREYTWKRIYKKGCPKLIMAYEEDIRIPWWAYQTLFPLHKNHWHSEPFWYDKNIYLILHKCGNEQKKMFSTISLNRSFVRCRFTNNWNKWLKCSVELIFGSDTMLSLFPIKDSTGTRWIPKYNEIRKLIYT